jgi:iron complex outermembrane recepter protein
MTFRTKLLAAAAILVASPALAQTAGTFNLGQIETVTVTAEQANQPIAMSQSVLTNETLYTYHDTSLNQTLDMMPGVAASNSGGSRNEQLLFVHGFDRFQTPISIDGIRVYLPADNRLDFGRFLTADISQVQVAKGYVSVLNGPGALGGAINLVTRKPVGEFDVDARSGLTLGTSESLDAEDASLSVGTNQGTFYLQGSVAWVQQRHFELSDSYVPTATQPGGFRINSRTRDLTIHAKAGYTPNDTDEYSISYIQETGAKDAPFAVSDPVSTQRDWSWPYWDISSVYFLSTTSLGDSSYVKTRAYYNTFTNGLFSYDDATFTLQTKPKSFDSYYDDYAYGGNVELGTDLFAGDTLKGSFFYRRDNHDETQQLFSPKFLEPHQLDVEDTYSLALENTWHATSAVDLVGGVSYDWRHLLKAQDFVDPTTPTGTGTFINYPLADGSALNGQAALIWNATDTSSYYFNISDRTRFPTVFERFSTRFGTAASNPGLKTERAANFELGTKQNILGWQLNGSVFYSDVSNAIEAVILPPPAPAGTTQSQNVGHGAFYGFEAETQGQITDNLSLGANYTYQIRHIHVPANVAPLQLTGDPAHKGFVWLNWNVIPDLTLTPNLSLASNRWTTNTAGTIYYKTGAFALLGVSMNYRVAEQFDIDAGIKNLADTNYQLTGGFPEAGRTFFVQLRFRQ